MSDDSATHGAHTVRSVLEGASGWLSERSADGPRRSAELLLGHVLGLPRLELYLQHDRPLDDAERSRMRDLVARRGQGEPVAYLIGSWEFRHLELEVGPGVLVPRPETEELVDLVLARKPVPCRRAIDLGTGSGALALSLAQEIEGLDVDAVEREDRALGYAKRNLRATGLEDRVRLLSGSWWDPVENERRYDLVVSNPPYVDPDRSDLLEDAVRKYEPASALFTPAGKPGQVYADLVAGLEAHTESGALVVFETGVGAAEPAKAALASAPFLRDVELVSDLAGLPRFVVGVRR